MISPQGPPRAFGRKELLRGQAVIASQQIALPQKGSGSLPPLSSGRARFGGEPIRQYGLQFLHMKKTERGVRGKNLGLRITDFGPGFRRHSRPDKIFVFHRDAPFKPGPGIRIPAEAMNRQRIEQFVGENDSLYAGWRQLFQGMEPADLRGEPLQCSFLPLLSPG